MPSSGGNVSTFVEATGAKEDVRSVARYMARKDTALLRVEHFEHKVLCGIDAGTFGMKTEQDSAVHSLQITARCVDAG